MDEENNNTELYQEEKQTVFNTVTPLSRMLALVLFIVLPFVGFWLGYKYAPEKIVEIEKVVVKEVDNTTQNNPVFEYGKQVKTLNNEETNTDASEAVLVNDLGETVPVNLNELKQVGEYYFIDSERNRIYYLYGTTENEVSPGEQIVLTLKDTHIADVESFIVYENDGRYAHDSLNVYGVLMVPWEWVNEFGVVENADHASFEPSIVKDYNVSQGNSYWSWVSKDKDNVYYRHRVIYGADPKTFEITEDVAINRDANNVYLWWKILPEADPETYEVVLHLAGGAPGDVYGKDEKNFFMNYCVVSGVDVDTVIHQKSFSFYDKIGEFEVEYKEGSNTCLIKRD